MASPQGSIVAGIAIAHSGCSSRGPTPADVDRYAELIVRPSDPQTTAARAYYLQNPSLSTCGLTVLGCWRLAGLPDAEVAGAYYPGRVGQAFSNMETVASRYGAWEGGAPRGLLLAGDVWIITDAAGGDAHTGLCVVVVSLQLSSTFQPRARSWARRPSEAAKLRAAQAPPRSSVSRGGLGVELLGSPTAPEPEHGEELEDHPGERRGAGVVAPIGHGVGLTERVEQPRGGPGL